MGAYGTPEHLPPQKPIGKAKYYEPLRQNGEDMKWICRHCGIEYRGRYCPSCGTKTGKKHPSQLTWKMTLFLLFMGWVLGMIIWIGIYAWSDVFKALSVVSGA